MSLEYLQPENINLGKIPVPEDFTILIPLHNEAEKISTSLNVLLSYLRTLPFHVHILFVENGSSDATVIKLKTAVSTFENVSYITLPKACLGNALYEGIMHSQSEDIVYLPIDLSIGLDFVQRSLSLLRGNDIVVGSKRKHGGSDRRPLIRRTFSASYHFLTRLFFGIDVTDTTCVKAFKKSSVVPLLGKTRFNNIFETELVVRAKMAGRKVAEIPVIVNDRRLPRENLLKKVLRKLIGVLTFRLTLFFEDDAEIW
jgi:glycosyltransferase involved in cell wall biosynthesis